MNEGRLFDVRLGLVLFLVSALSAPLAALAEPRPLLRVGQETPFAVSGNEVIFAGRARPRGLAIRAVPLLGGPFATRYLYRPPRRTFAQVFELEASHQLVAFHRAVGAHGRQRSAIFTGPPVGPFTPFTPGGKRPSGAILVDADTLAVVQEPPSEHPVGVVSPMKADGERSVVVSLFPARGRQVRRKLRAEVAYLTLAGPYLAYLEVDDSQSLEFGQVVVIDWRTGRRLYRTRVKGNVVALDLAPDGRTAIEAEVERGNALHLADRNSTKRLLVSPIDGIEPQFAGRFIVIKRPDPPFLQHVGAIDPATGRTWRLGATSESVTFDTDGESVAWTANGCLLSTSAAQPGAEVTPPGPCPRSETLALNQDNRISNRLRVKLRCVNSAERQCRGRVSLTYENDGRSFGSRPFAIPRGRAGTLRVPITKKAEKSFRRALRGSPQYDCLGFRVVAVTVDAAGRRSQSDYGNCVFPPRKVRR